MSRKVRMSDIAEASSWHFGVELTRTDRSTRRQMEALRCAYAAGRQIGFTWSAIAEGVGRERSTVVYALHNGHQPEPNDVAAVLANARARALADVFA